MGLSLPTQREERWVRERQVMEAEAKRLGLDLRVEVTDNDATMQALQCERLIAQGISVLILAPHDATRAASIVDSAARAGVKVISYDRLVLGSPHASYYLSFDSAKVGELQAEYLLSVASHGNYLVLLGPSTDHSSQLLRDGAMKVLGPRLDRGDIKVLVEQQVPDWQATHAQRIVSRALEQAKNQVAAVLAPNDSVAGGAILALAEHQLAGRVPVTGQDADLAAAVRIVRGTQAMTLFKDTRQLGRKAIEMAKQLTLNRPIATRKTIHNGTRLVPAVLLTPFVVTRENLDAMLIDSGYLNRDHVYPLATP